LELLLNLCWLLLIGPGIYLWLRQRGRTKSAFQFSIALTCLLFLLFPVISVSDDLHAMRAEMEESSPGKRVLKQIAKRVPGQDSSAPPARLSASSEVPPLTWICLRVQLFLAPAELPGYTAIPASRPPPSSFLA